jgi:phage terminase large subunit-like protein
LTKMPDSAQDFRFDEGAADYACNWIEKCCVFTEDRWAGQPFKLSQWQRDRIIRPFFGWKRQDGTRRYRRCIVWVPRKNGKTELAASVSLLGLMATGVVGGQAYALARDEKQARLVFDKASRMIGWSPVLFDKAETLKDAIFVPDLDARFQPLSGSAAGKHGLSPTVIIGDEVHEWVDDRLYTFVHQGTAAREEPIEFLISTAGTQEGYGWELWQECQAILDGTRNDPETLVVIFAADPEADWTDPATWRAANPNLGTSVNLEYLKAECAKAQASPRLENDFKRFHLNLWTEQDVRWVPMDLWRQCSATPGDVDLWRSLGERLAGRQCFIGIDLAQTHDITAMVAVVPPEHDDQPWTILPQFFVPQYAIERRSESDRVPYAEWARLGMITATPGRVTDYEFLKEATYSVCEKFQVNAIAFDRWNASHIMNEMGQEGLPVTKFGQGYVSMSGPMKEMERLIFSGQIEHGNHPVLTWMARNTGYDQDPAGNIKPSRQKSKEKIDGIVATIMALGEAMGQEREGPGAYRGHGIMVL